MSNPPYPFTRETIREIVETVSRSAANPARGAALERQLLHGGHVTLAIFQSYAAGLAAAVAQQLMTRDEHAMVSRWLIAAVERIVVSSKSLAEVTKQIAPARPLRC